MRPVVRKRLTDFIQVEVEEQKSSGALMPLCQEIEKFRDDDRYGEANRGYRIGQTEKRRGIETTGRLPSFDYEWEMLSPDRWTTVFNIRKGGPDYIYYLAVDVLVNRDHYAGDIQEAREVAKRLNKRFFHPMGLQVKVKSFQPEIVLFRFASLRRFLRGASFLLPKKLKVKLSLISMEW